MNYQVGNYISTEYGELPIKHVVFDQYQVIGKDGRTLWANKVDPIELTEEWLTKFGFTVENSFAYSTGEEVAYNVFSKSELTFNSIQDCWWLCGKPMKRQPKYVHQLQLLYFALTGTELKINV